MHITLVTGDYISFSQKKKAKNAMPLLHQPGSHFLESCKRVLGSQLKQRGAFHVW